MECYYFGTFNPVHKGHIQTANDVLNKFGFTNVIFVPAFNPPHKGNCAKASDRFNMLKLIENEGLKVSDIEFNLPKPSFSYQTINELLKNKKEGEKINFIIGFDAFKNIEKWKNPEILKEKVHFIVLKRTGENRGEIEKLKDRGYDFTITDNIDTIDVSSTDIREKIQQGASISGLLD
ncbi:MAG: nicotinate (nicotinamide) nucleotide adenylyltransferase [bacterium]|nr:nicotinate (nicotinamide) nucleotide adenylyltransferase [bacterium]